MTRLPETTDTFKLPSKYADYVSLAVLMERYVDAKTTDPASIIAQQMGIQLWGVNDLEMRELTKLRNNPTATQDAKTATYLSILGARKNIGARHS